LVVVLSVQRIVALKQIAFEKAKFDGYLVFNPSNLVYFTGFSGTTALLIPMDGEGTIYVYGVNYEQALVEAKGFRVEPIKRGADLMAKIAQRAQECGIKSLALDTLSVEGWRSLAKEARGKTKLKAKPVFVAQLRAVKNEEEIALMRKASELTSFGMKAAYEMFSSGMKEFEVAAEIEYAMRKHGSYGTAFDTAVSSGPASAFPHGGCSDREIRSGELVVVDFGAVYKSYRSDMTRTLVAGKPSERQQKIHAVVKRAQEEAFTAIRPSAKARDVDAVARKVIEEAGYGEFFVHGLGHGVGLGIHEPPTLNSASKETLKEGNVVTDEPGVYLVGYGGVRIEDTLLVTKKGAEKLTIGPYGLCGE
jgi:Xaa-Pro aminopeptidase